MTERKTKMTIEKGQKERQKDVEAETFKTLKERKTKEIKGKKRKDN